VPASSRSIRAHKPYVPYSESMVLQAMKSSCGLDPIVSGTCAEMHMLVTSTQERSHSSIFLAFGVLSIVR
jgi:hypothetical protein